MQYYSVTKRKKKPSSHEKTQGNVKCILGSETSQSEKAIYCIIPTI